MPNSYFRFKQFAVHQDQCAMKVCTDSCLFGAWTANELKDTNAGRFEVLDIGAGTGLLSLFLAQKLSSANIDSVEIEPLCFEQAKANVLQSPWKERIQVYHADINHFLFRKKYDFIISNPPFYETDLPSGNAAKNIAHHNAGLTLHTLLINVKKLLKDNGRFAVLLPYHRSPDFENLVLQEGFFVNKKTFVKQTVQHSFFRTFLFISKAKTSVTEDEIAIKDLNNKYTEKFVSLLKDYYLYL